MSSDYDFIVVGGRFLLDALSLKLIHSQPVPLVASLQRDLQTPSNDPKCFSSRQDQTMAISPIESLQIDLRHSKKLQ
jgi:hypothetical protein